MAQKECVTFTLRQELVFTKLFDPKELRGQPIEDTKETIVEEGEEAYGDAKCDWTDPVIVECNNKVVAKMLGVKFKA